MKRRIPIVAFTAFLFICVLSTQANAQERVFIPIRTYEEQFSDVNQDDWYYDTVKVLYELGLMNGKDHGDRFDPDGALTGAEVAAMAARLHSLYQTGGCETGPAAYAGDGGPWYQPYASYLKAEGVIGEELDGSYHRPATRAETAHALARALPENLFTSSNEDMATLGYEAGRYITDVTPNTPYADDILRLYAWGVSEGADQTGSFHPEDNISRCWAAVMTSRLVYSEQRVTLNWAVHPAYYLENLTLADLVDSDGSFYAAPAPDEQAKIDADVRYMLSRGERNLNLQYPSGMLTKAYADALTRAFLEGARNYVEQTYNFVQTSYSTSSGHMLMSFGSSFYPERQIEHYREETMAYAIEVHNRLWEEGELTENMTQYEKARVYFTWVCDNCRYDHASTTESMSHTGYRLFSEHLAVCDGYTAAYNLLLKLDGIDCSAYSTADHIWTVAELDGRTYHIDTTWGDRDDRIDYRFFAMTELDAVSRFR